MDEVDEKTISPSSQNAASLSCLANGRPNGSLGR